MNVLILHGITGHAGIHWQQWLHDELVQLGHTVLMPTLPSPDHPDRTECLQFVEELTKNLDTKELIIVGHSLGVATALDFIEKHLVKALFSVSGFSQDYGSDLNSYFMKEKDINMEKVKKNCKNFILFFGDNDPYVPQESLSDLAEKLQVKPHIIHDGGHLNTETGFTTFPLLLDLLQSNV